MLPLLTKPSPISLIWSLPIAVLLPKLTYTTDPLALSSSHFIGTRSNGGIDDLGMDETPGISTSVSVEDKGGETEESREGRRCDELRMASNLRKKGSSLVAEAESGRGRR
ncbi:hypothetical protein Lal_00030962 [Lupinus albus]|nr:hypothetical protein Lal_00030962 [Lupinus albus]